MKPSLSYFPTLTDESKYPVWRRKFQSMCNGTNLGEVLSLTYRPNEEDLESFRNKCMWVYTVLEHTVHTTEGRNILEKHRARSDGRAVLRDLDAHGRTSTASQLQARRIMERLVTTPLTRTWSKPIVDYLSWFLRQVNQYNELALVASDRLTPTMVRTMLERNVQAAPSLVAVRDRELFEIARGGPPLSLSQYIALLKSAAATMDTKRNRTFGSRRGNVHESGESTSDNATDDRQSSGDDDDDASAMAELEVFMTRQRTPGSSMDRATWQSLDKSTHSAWDMISPEDKAKILSYAMDRAKRNEENRKLSANVAEQDNADSLTESDSPSAEGTSEDVSSDDAEMEANVSKGKPSHPGDLRRMMGKQPSRSGKNPTRASNVVRFEANSTRRTPSDWSQTPSDEWGGDSQASSSQSVPPFQSEPAPDEMDAWGTSPASSPAFDEFEDWETTNTVPNNNTDSSRATLAPISEDPFSLDAIWDEDQHFY